MKNLNRILITLVFIISFNCQEPPSKLDPSNLKNVHLGEENPNQKKKILFYLGLLENGGLQKAMINLLNHLNYSKYEIGLILTGETKSEFLFNQIPKEVNIIRMDEFPSSFEEFSKISSYDLEIICRIEDIAKIVINSSCKSKLAWIHMDLKNYKYFEPADYFSDAIENLPKIDEIITVSHQSKQILEDLIPEIKNKVKVIYNIIDIEEVNKRSQENITEKKDELTQLVAIGRLHPQKGLDRLIEACHRLKNKDNLHFHLWIVGEGPERANLEDQIQKYNLEGTIKLIRFRENPYPYMREADLFVLSSRHECMPYVILEAMILNKPIVSTNVSGPGELLKATLAQGELTSKGEYGLLTENSEEGIYEGLKQMITDKSLRDSFTNKNPDFSAFETSNVVKQVEALFDKVISQ